MVSFLRGGSRSFSGGLLPGSLTAHPLKSYQFTIPKRKVSHLPTYPSFRGQLAVKLQEQTARGKPSCGSGPCWLDKIFRQKTVEDMNLQLPQLPGFDDLPEVSWKWMQ